MNTEEYDEEKCNEFLTNYLNVFGELFTSDKSFINTTVKAGRISEHFEQISDEDPETDVEICITKLNALSLVKNDHLSLTDDLFEEISQKTFLQEWFNSYKKYSESFCIEKLNSLDDESIKSWNLNKHSTDEDVLIPHYEVFNPSFVESFGELRSISNIYIFSPKIKFTVQDVLMFSPSIFNESCSKRLFVLYQLLNIYTLISEKYPWIQLDTNLWHHISINQQLWIQIAYSKLNTNLFELYSIQSLKVQKNSEEILQTASALELWVSFKVNFFSL